MGGQPSAELLLDVEGAEERAAVVAGAEVAGADEDLPPEAEAEAEEAEGETKATEVDEVEAYEVNKRKGLGGHLQARKISSSEIAARLQGCSHHKNTYPVDLTRNYKCQMNSLMCQGLSDGMRRSFSESPKSKEQLMHRPPWASSRGENANWGLFGPSGHLHVQSHIGSARVTSTELQHRSLESVMGSASSQMKFLDQRQTKSLQWRMLNEHPRSSIQAGGSAWLKPAWKPPTGADNTGTWDTKSQTQVNSWAESVSTRSFHRILHQSRSSSTGSLPVGDGVNLPLANHEWRKRARKTEEETAEAVAQERIKTSSHSANCNHGYVSCSERQAPWSVIQTKTTTLARRRQQGHVRGFVDSIKAEKDAARLDAASRSLDVALWLERRGHPLKIRETIENDVELRLALTPSRPGTALRHVRMLGRFWRFDETRGLKSAGAPLTRKHVARWIADMKVEQVGLHTIKFALQAIKYFSEQLEIDEKVSGCAMLKSEAKWCLDEPRKERDEHGHSSGDFCGGSKRA